MHTSRRTFIKTGSMALISTAVLSKTAFAAPKKKNVAVGMQLYSVRDDMAKDPLGSLKQIAAMGYKNVEHANYVNRKFYGYSASEFRKILDDLGLHNISGHTVFGVNHWDDSTKDFTDSWKYTVEDAAVLGQKYVISPWMDEKMRNNAENLKKYLEIFNKCGELCQKSGMKFGYHNHDFEFSQKINNESVFDIIMNGIDPKMVVIQLDTGNLYNGGAKTLDVLNKFPNRFENVHLKDEIKAGAGEHSYESTILGKGIISCKEVADLAYEKGGAKLYIIEQEAYQGKAPMECMKENLEIMKQWGYV
jgi:sugar phosphate isomerase/epimerase